ncbi:FAD:protein FMN transferase [Phaeobacter sp. 11ANDIMAR09]|uniref:FAD:protein FMN transferase n=1 Tax=Phaeobacter sp. 11ANDIMAR09 TaxID=1225647 RepID=UPI0006C870A5|nr:FAD:protein FMN transferase [Phaeobacter sp. 11ANDIMAR09]
MALNFQHIFLFSGGLFRRLAGCGFVVMLVLQMLFPSLGKAAGSGRWIEICSEFGAVEVQIPLEDQNSQDRECPGCDSCLICLAENGQTRSTQVASFTLVSACYKRLAHPAPMPGGRNSGAVLGQRPDGTAWHVSVAAPEGELRAKVSLSDRALATSAAAGTLGGKGSSHILDPRTGYGAAKTGLISEKRA